MLIKHERAVLPEATLKKAARILIEAEDEYFDRNQQESAQRKEDIDE